MLSACDGLAADGSEVWRRKQRPGRRLTAVAGACGRNVEAHLDGLSEVALRDECECKGSSQQATSWIHSRLSVMPLK
jgi:hypothetical protein